MIDYCDIGDLQDVLRETVEDTDLEDRANKCITTASALVDAFLKVRSMAVPNPKFSASINHRSNCLVCGLGV